jgi:flagellar basal-body rod modification protein FlgD
MTAVASVSSTPSAPPPSVSSTDALGATQDRFLKLLIAQMQNQDPLNPMDNSQVTSQMAQLSTVTGINKLNDLVSGLSSSFSATQSLQAAGMIGHGVLVPGNSLALAAGNAIGAVDLPQAVDQLSITIKDASGATVHSANLGAQSSGITSFQWDGTNDNGTMAPDGQYTYAVQAVAAGQTVSASSLAYGKVSSVTLGAQGAQLNIDGIVGGTALSQVQQIL